MRKRVKRMSVGAISLVGQGANPESNGFLIMQSAPLETIDPTTLGSTDPLSLICQQGIKEINEEEEAAFKMEAADRLNAALRDFIAPTVVQTVADEVAEIRARMGGWDIWQGFQEYLRENVHDKDDATAAIKELADLLEAELTAPTDDDGDEAPSQSPTAEADDDSDDDSFDAPNAMPGVVGQDEAVVEQGEAVVEQDEFALPSEDDVVAQTTENTTENTTKNTTEGESATEAVSEAVTPDTDEAIAQADVEDSADVGGVTVVTQRSRPLPVRHGGMWGSMLDTIASEAVGEPVSEVVTQGTDLESLIAQAVAKATQPLLEKIDTLSKRPTSRQPDADPRPPVAQSSEKKSVWQDGPLGRLIG